MKRIENTKIQRQTRFQPDPTTGALIDFKLTKVFNPTVLGIVVNESLSGCSLILATDEIVSRGTKIKLKIGELAPLQAQIVWSKNLEENIYKIGVKIIE